MMGTVVVSVMAVGVERIALSKMPVVGMDIGIAIISAVFVIPVGGMMIVPKVVGKHIAAIMGPLLLIPPSPMADSVIVMMVTPVRIVRLLIKNRNRCLKKGDPRVAFRMF